MCEKGSGCSVSDRRGSYNVGSLFLGCSYFEDCFLGNCIFIYFNGVVVGFVIGWECSSACCWVGNCSVSGFILV